MRHVHFAQLTSVRFEALFFAKEGVVNVLLPEKYEKYWREIDTALGSCGECGQFAEYLYF